MRVFTSKDGTRIACFVSGSGPPLVLVHGAAADHTRWKPVLPFFEPRHTAYACDRRGRGRERRQRRLRADRGARMAACQI